MMTTDEPTSHPHDVLTGMQLNRADDPAMFTEALIRARDYRGDITLHGIDDATYEGFIFDVTVDDQGRASQVRLLLAHGGQRISVHIDDLRSLHFSGKDTAAGKSFEGWVKRYVQRKLEGLPASIENDPLEEDD
jgi:hypothetical protein